MEDPEQRVERVLETGLERIDTPEAAHAVVRRLERLSAGQTEADAGQQAAEQTRGATDQAASAAGAIERAASAPRQVPPEHAVADTLDEVARLTVAPTPAAEPVVAAAQGQLTPSQPTTPEAHRGRRLLKDAVLRRMGPLNALDARVYLIVNEAPHPGVLDRAGWLIALVFTGGWIWILATLLAYLLHVPRSSRALRRLLPGVLVATWIIENPIKAFFRRRRPFVSIVRALVIGKKPGSWSFPSGHTGSAFASAWILSTVWPRRAPVFFGVAGIVGFSRVYVGAHYPGDVASGAFFGVLLSELVRRLVR